MKKPYRILLKSFFVLLFVLGAYYTIFIETQKYRSSAIISVRDLSSNQAISALGAMLLPQGPGPSQDSSILQLYVASEDMYHTLDRDLNLTAYYTSDRIDFARRLYPDSPIPWLDATADNLLRHYRSDLSTAYDPASATLTLSYQHADAHTAQRVVRTLITASQEVLNRFEQENAEVTLKFLEKQEAKYKQRFIDAVGKLIAYQTRHNTFDPKIDIEAKSTLLATLQSELIKKEITYKSRLARQKRGTPEMRTLYDAIASLRSQIARLQKAIAGLSPQKLNTKVYDFETLKSQVEFAKEMYKQTLIKVESTRLSVNKSTKNLIIITHPTLPQSYTSPRKLKQVLTILLVLWLLYGIIRLVVFIIRDHKD